jgi:hypothetical protein
LPTVLTHEEEIAPLAPFILKQGLKLFFAKQRFMLWKMKIQTMLAQVTLPIGILALVALAPLDAIAKPLALSKIPGTTVQIAPPEGFQSSKFFPGFEQKQTGATILVTEMPIPKAQNSIAQFTSANVLKLRGMTLIESSAISIDGKPAKLLLVAQSNQGIKFLKWIAVIGAGDRALIATASFPESQAAALKEPLRQAIISLRWMSGTVVQPLEGLTFSFQPAGDLQISGRVSNTVLLTKNGVKPPIPEADPIMVLGSALSTLGSSFSQVSGEDLAAFSRLRLRQTTQVTELTETSGNLKTLAGHPAFELVATGYGLKTRTPLTVYQVIVSTNETYYILQGLVSQASAQKYLPMFRAVADSLKINP